MSEALYKPGAIQNLHSRQAYALIALGLLCLVLAWLIHPSTSTYPIGVLVLGVGLLIAAILNPARLVIASSLTAPLGLAVYLVFKQLITGSVQILAAYILAIGLGLLIIALMGRRGYVGVGAMTPGIMVIGVGVIELLLAKNLTPPNFIPFMLSLWLPGIGLLLIGIAYWLTSRRV